MVKNVVLKSIRFTFWLSTALLAGSSTAYSEYTKYKTSSNQPHTPDTLLGSLFDTVQKKRIYPDQKTFADAIPKYDPASILSYWQAQKNQHDFNLKKFIEKNFILPKEQNKYVPPIGQSLREHINNLWPVLTRTSQHSNQYDSLLSLPKPYVVPGGRFREVYYWDSYFTMLGLAESGHWDIVQNMIDNFASQLNKYGHIPNGNRSYYLSRSQPPFFSLMIDLLAQHKGDKIYRQYLPQMKKEYNYWMEDSNTVTVGHAIKRVVKLTNGTLLNRYWDDRDVPRTESWLDDINTAKKAPKRNKKQVYRDLRSGAASGWDFSSRWFADAHNLASIHITQLVPIDLNSLLFHLEKTLAKASKIANKYNDARKFNNYAKKRQIAINRYLWDKKNGWYADYNWKKRKITNQLTAATLFPLYTKLAYYKQAKRVASVVDKQLLKPGGLITTTINSGQQWDAPNGWAPLQWVAIEGLEHYNQFHIANTIGHNFLQNVQQTYNKEHKLIEKYIVEGTKLGGGIGGEYPLQDGFGWTNAVTLLLLDKYCPKDKICNNANTILNSNIKVLNTIN
ncbi:alpha,alpha-trehalase TreA [Pantoea sp. Aalb]|uniref:alpha,alpha-trehalase TreA n=1 Tax=Pantoea sp. Aalb TaxID=2576762 RepID=UPI0013246869|nr:alpha,alpha-trehalase TreA [Pantoea sp. Aalb]MXP67441.1 alpha,alpha-trehalase TreA [Pantoea sp. Aalb]